LYRILAPLIAACAALGGVSVQLHHDPGAGTAVAEAATTHYQVRHVPAVANRSYQREGIDDAQAIHRVIAREQARAIRAAQRAAHLRALRAERARAAAARAKAAAAASVTSSSAEGWAHTYMSIRVSNCESGGTPQGQHYDGNIHAVNPSGYYGKWQFALGTWSSVGGSGNPAYASEAEQDYRAWLLWKRDGWSPWQCAGMV
jgi:hypothetical protein